MCPTGTYDKCFSDPSGLAHRQMSPTPLFRSFMNLQIVRRHRGVIVWNRHSSGAWAARRRSSSRFRSGSLRRLGGLVRCSRGGGSGWCAGKDVGGWNARRALTGSIRTLRTGRASFQIGWIGVRRRLCVVDSGDLTHEWCQRCY